MFYNVNTNIWNLFCRDNFSFISLELIKTAKTEETFAIMLREVKMQLEKQ